MKINTLVTNNENNYDDEIEIISTTDMKGITTSANADFMQISGFDHSEIMGKNPLLSHKLVIPAKAGIHVFNVLSNQLLTGYRHSPV